MSKKSLLVIIGPTGIGKTALSIKLAQSYMGEIISADSRQIYHFTDIGTAKPTPEERAAVPHHLIDCVPPDQTMTLAEFQTLAYETINRLHIQGRLPLLVGGTGQWVKAVVEGWGIPRVPPDPELRAELQAEAEATSSEALYARLADVDPLAAAKLDHRNLRRVIRALEVYHKTGLPISTHQQKSPPPYNILQIGLTMPREQLYQRIDQRIERMLDQGLLAEIKALRAQGYPWELPAMSGLGYKQLGAYLRGEGSLDEAVALIKKETRRFIRQQYNWFRVDDPEIRWVDVSQIGFEEIVMAEINRFFKV